MHLISKSLVLSAFLVAGTSLGALAQDHPDEHHDDHAPPHAMEKKTVTHTQEHVVEKKTVVHEDVHRAGPAPGRRVAAGHWNRGQRFSGNRAVFTDYDRYHVRRPPPGYEWVQDGNELVLIGLNDGLISDTFVITVP